MRQDLDGIPEGLTLSGRLKAVGHAKVRKQGALAVLLELFIDDLLTRLAAGLGENVPPAHAFRYRMLIG
jgi:hypothetical protein